MHELYVGLISGTSMDGVDAVLVDFAADQPILLASHNHPIPSTLRQQLHTLCQPQANEIQHAAQADRQVALLFAEAVTTLLEQANTEPGQVQAIGSHGQTIRHFPEASIRQSLQLGDPSLIASRTGIRCVADFRRRDMAEGGEGAPLVPAFHRAVFSQAGQNRVIINIGGISNITTLPADPGRKVMGFDTGPGNTLLDAWTRHHINQPMDENGVWAASGTSNETLLNALLADDYFQRPPPKSTGRELFNEEWQQRVMPGLQAAMPPEDVAATLVELSCGSIADAIRLVMPDTDAAYVCGGGASNPCMMRQLQARLRGSEVQSTAVLGIPPDWVEAMAFAWLARQAILGEPGNVPEVTGARRAVVLGGIYPA